MTNNPFSGRIAVCNDARFSNKRPRTTGIYRTIGSLKLEDLSLATNRAREATLAWVRRKAGDLPKKAWEFQDFTIDEPGIKVDAIRIHLSELDYWTLRFEHLDNKEARVWTTEVTIAQTKEWVKFGISLTLSASKVITTRPHSVPTLVKSIIESCGFVIDGVEISAQAKQLSNESDVNELVDLISNQERVLPVIVVSQKNNEKEHSSSIDCDKLSQLTVGLAHVYLLSASCSEILTSKIGSPFSVFNGAVRTYNPCCDFDIDSPRDHPFTTWKTIAEWSDEREYSYVETIAKYVATQSIWKSNNSELLPFSEVRRKASEHRKRKAHQSGHTSIEVYEYKKENELLRDDIEKALQMAEDEEDQKRAIKIRHDELEKQNYILLSRIRHLESRLATNYQHQTITIPRDYKSIRPWAEEHFAGRIVVTSKASRAAKNAEFEDITFVYNVLQFIAIEYWNMKTNASESNKMAYTGRLNDLGLENSPCGEESRLREMGDEFLVDWKGRKRLLLQHFKTKTSTRDPSRCFRLYYFWDGDTQQVVIGSLPGHLTTQAS